MTDALDRQHFHEFGWMPCYNVPDWVFGRGCAGVQGGAEPLAYRLLTRGGRVTKHPDAISIVTGYHPK